ncbi:MAG: FHA domain-containing protein [Gemmatimonadetes bacterium]|nr:FHA domain-containing protein [Gemmatimonadota bacterium]
MSIYLALAEQRTGAKYEFETSPVRVGRAPGLDLTVTGEGAGVVSGNHASFEHDGKGWNLTDLGSSNGTFVDGTRLTRDVPFPLRNGSVIKLGDTGPQYRVSAVTKRVVAATILEKAAPADAAATIRLATPVPPAASVPAARPPAGAKPGARTAAFEKMVAAEQQKSASNLRNLGIGAITVVLLVVASAVVYSRRQAARNEAALAARAAEVVRQAKANDSLRLVIAAEADELRARLAQAAQGGASSSVVESLTSALASANQRTAALETSLQRAEAAVARQQRSADSVRAASQAELQRLRDELAKAGTGRVAARQRDSLQKKLVAAEEKAAEVERLDARVKAANGANLAQVAQASGPAVGLVTAWFGARAVTGAGVVLSASGVVATTRHAVRDGANEPDSISLTLNGTHKALTVSELEVSEAGGADLAVLQVDEYSGPFVKRVDWKGAALREGEPAAIVGVAAGPLDATAVVRTIVSAGIVGATSADQVQYDATSSVGASGSAVFNAAGELVAIHLSKLPKGYGAAPMSLVRKLVPRELRKDLGI